MVYKPTDQYDVKLDIFEGPIDLLLYLIRKNDLDIYDIPISHITSEYLSYLDVMKELNLNVAGEFLVMASTLMQIKAKMLLPSTSSESEEGPDPRAELVAKLLEYQKYKDAAKQLSSKAETVKDVYYRPAPTFSEEDFVLDAALFDLLGAFKQVLSEVKDEVKEILYEEIPIELKIREILDLLEGKSHLTFREIFERETTLRGFIVLFLALLELIRSKQITARQSRLYGEIRVYKVETVDSRQ